MATRRRVCWGRIFSTVLAALIVVDPATVLGSVPAGAATSVNAPGGSYEALTPARIADTRSGLGGVPAAATTALVVATAGRAGVPATGVSAVAVNITVTGPSAAGNLTAYATGSPKPGTSTANFVRWQTVAHMAVVPVNPTGQFTIANTTPPPTVVAVAGDST